MINEIASASEDQAQAVAQVTSGIEQISSVVQKNSATASESADASTELNSQAEKLQEQIRQFHLRDMDGRISQSAEEAKDHKEPDASKETDLLEKGNRINEETEMRGTEEISGMQVMNSAIEQEYSDSPY